MNLYEMSEKFVYICRLDMARMTTKEVWTIKILYFYRKRSLTHSKRDEDFLRPFSLLHFYFPPTP